MSLREAPGKYTAGAAPACLGTAPGLCSLPALPLLESSSPVAIAPQPLVPKERPQQASRLHPHSKQVSSEAGPGKCVPLQAQTEGLLIGPQVWNPGRNSKASCFQTIPCGKPRPSERSVLLLSWKLIMQCPRRILFIKTNAVTFQTSGSETGMDGGGGGLPQSRSGLPITDQWQIGGHQTGLRWAAPPDMAG